MKVSIRPSLRLALTLLFILAVYFQSISHPLSRFDDPGIVNAYGLNGTLSFLDVISLGDRFYYRPLVNLSYWLDFQLWDMQPSAMHLENVVIHVVNALFVFLITTRLPKSSQSSLLPYCSALVFGLHPINTESINWIPGRTDVYAGLFVFIAIYCLIRSLQEQSTLYAFIAFGSAFTGILAKETAIMFLPAAFLLSMTWPVVTNDVSRYKIWRSRFIIAPIMISFVLFISLLMLVYIKGHGNNAVSLIFDVKSDVFLRSLEAFGFYVKKMFLPLPLNVAIVAISPLYAVAGIIFICMLVVSFRRIGIPGNFLILSVLFSIPALVIAVTSFAWTPFGERYLYIPSAFAVIGCLELFQRFMMQRNMAKLYFISVSIIATFFTVATIQRGILWGDNLALLEDIVAKSPNFGVARNEYGVLLKQDGRIKDAEKQFEIALQQKNKENVNRVIRRNLSLLKIYGKSSADARFILLSEVGNKADGDIELLKQINRYNEEFFREAASLADKKNIVADIIEMNEIIYQKTGDPYYLYRSGQYALFIGDKDKAAAYFREVSENDRSKPDYREMALKLAKKLESK